MKKSLSIIAAAAMAASLTLAGTMSAYAADEQQTTTAAAEETHEPTVKLADIVGKWKFVSTNILFVGDVEDITNTYEISKTEDKFSGTVEIKEDGTYTNTYGSTTENGTVKISTEEINGVYADTVNFYVGEEFSFGGYYRSDSGKITIGNGGMLELVRDNGESAETTTTATAATTTTTTTAADTTTTTAAATTTTTKAAGTTTTKAGTGSPKTGVAFPAIPVAGVTVAAVAVAFAIRKKED